MLLCFNYNIFLIKTKKSVKSSHCSIEKKIDVYVYKLERRSKQPGSFRTELVQKSFYRSNRFAKTSSFSEQPVRAFKLGNEAEPKN